MNELLPCPFCGGEARLASNMTRSDNWVICRECNIYYPNDTRRKFTEAEAIKAWNSRTERTCKPTEEYCCQCGQDLVLCDIGIGSNGGAVELDPPILFNYCPNCGCKVVGE